VHVSTPFSALRPGKAALAAEPWTATARVSKPRKVHQACSVQHRVSGNGFAGKRRVHPVMQYMPAREAALKFSEIWYSYRKAGTHTCILFSRLLNAFYLFLG